MDYYGCDRKRVIRIEKDYADIPADGGRRYDDVLYTARWIANGFSLRSN